MASNIISNTEVCPLWWYFDGERGTLYCEVEVNGVTEFRRETARIIPSEAYEGAWVGRTNCTSYILWKDKELATSNPYVAKIENWSLHGKCAGEPDPEWTFCLYIALERCLHWTCDTDEHFTVELDGNYNSGGHFTDSIRLVIPLRVGHTIAISKRNRLYFLFGDPVDQAAFEREERSREKANTHAKRKAARDARKADWLEKLKAAITHRRRLST